jgi:hypothetical protein
MSQFTLYLISILPNIKDFLAIFAVLADLFCIGFIVHASTETDEVKITPPAINAIGLMLIFLFFRAAIPSEKQIALIYGVLSW